MITALVLISVVTLVVAGVGQCALACADLRRARRLDRWAAAWDLPTRHLHLVSEARAIPDAERSQEESRGR